MRIHSLSKAVNGDCYRAEAKVEFERDARFHGGEKSATLWFEWPINYLAIDQINYDPFSLVGLTLASAKNERLLIEGAISNELYLNLVEAVGVYHWYFPEMAHEIDIQAEPVARNRLSSRRVGSFFSGGLDSLFNIADMLRLNQLTGSKKVTELWAVHGMDVPLQDIELWNKIEPRLKEIADSIGANFVPVKTNARELQTEIVHWTSMGFSVIMGAVAKLFATEIPCALIGSYDKYEFCVPHASSPLVDPLWSCDSQFVRHHTARVSRLEKLEVVRDIAPAILKYLRVCWLNQGGGFNCGKCEKCLRTQAELSILECLNKVTTFSNPEFISNVRQLDLSLSELKSGYTLKFWQEIGEQAEAHGKNELSKAVHHMIKKNKFSRPAKSLAYQLALRPRLKRMLLMK